MGKYLRVLVTGGAGFIGSHLVRALVKAGHSVRVLDDMSTGARERLAGIDCDVVEGDVRNAATVRRAMEGAEVVFHLAQVNPEFAPMAPLPLSPDERSGSQISSASIMRPLEPGFAEPARAEEVNVGGALHVLDAARRERVRRVVFAGSGEVYGRTAAYLLHEDVPAVPATIRAAQHLSVEQYARIFFEQHKVGSVVLRLFPVYGDGANEETRTGDAALVSRLLRAAVDGETPLVVGDPRQTRDLLHVDNAVQALIAAANIPAIDGGVYNVASGEATALGNLWGLLCELVGRKRQGNEPQYTPAPPWQQANVRVSIARATRDLGFQPDVRLKEGLRRTLAAFHEERAKDPNGWFAPPPVNVTPTAVAAVPRASGSSMFAVTPSAGPSAGPSVGSNPGSHLGSSSGSNATAAPTRDKAVYGNDGWIDPRKSRRTPPPIPPVPPVPSALPRFTSSSVATPLPSAPPPIPSGIRRASGSGASPLPLPQATTRRLTSDDDAELFVEPDAGDGTSDDTPRAPLVGGAGAGR